MANCESVDTSPAYRGEMRRKLYGIRRKKFRRKHALIFDDVCIDSGPSPNEALLSLDCNYADKVLPQWKSTMKAEFSLKKAAPTALV